MSGEDTLPDPDAPARHPSRRALSLFAPSLGLAPDYGDLLLDKPYPFSVAPDAPLERADLARVLRDAYEVGRSTHPAQQ
jgi:hypothetical protein